VTDAYDPRLAELPADLLLALDRVCDRFESACQTKGQAPAIEDYLNDVPATARETLRELLEGLAADYAAQRAAPAVAQQIGDYDLREELGRGGMGVVYRATHRRMKRDVAFKTLREEYRQDPSMRRRFAREIESAARLSHPNIVAAFDAGEIDGVAHLVCELIAGEDLAHLVRRKGPLPCGQAIDYIAQAARGLAYAHRNGLIHRDVKPSNLIVDGAGAVKLLDLGLARQDPSSTSDTAHSHHDLTGVNDLAGTAAFMAPEQALRPKSADARSDIYSLGCTLYYLLVGHPPYQGQTAFELLIAHRDQPIPPLISPHGVLPAAVRRLFARMVAKQPGERFKSMVEVLAALEDAQGVAVRPGRLSVRQRWGAAVSGGVLLSAALLWTSRTPPQATVAPSQTALAGFLPRAFAPSEAASQQQAWAERAGVPVEVKLPAGPTLRLLPAGEYQMGTPSDELESMLTRATTDAQRDYLRAEGPVRTVQFDRPFYFGATEVTFPEFRRFIEATAYRTAAERGAKGYGWHQASQTWQYDQGGSGYSWRNLGDLKITDEMPVMNIAWEDALHYCDWLNTQPSPAGVSLRVRLPWEREWEYAARAGSPAPWCFGDDGQLVRDYGWTTENARWPQPVGERRPNAFGLFDLYGNVSEWCGDRLEDRTDLHQPVNYETRVKRGGGFSDPPQSTRSAARRWLHPTTPYGGFRIAAEIVEKSSGSTATQ
jgi:serine/threonine protein kinase